MTAGDILNQTEALTNGSRGESPDVGPSIALMEGSPKSAPKHMGGECDRALPLALNYYYLLLLHDLTVEMPTRVCEYRRHQNEANETQQEAGRQGRCDD